MKYGFISLKIAKEYMKYTLTFVYGLYSAPSSSKSTFKMREFQLNVWRQLIRLETDVYQLEKVWFSHGLQIAPWSDIIWLMV